MQKKSQLHAAASKTTEMHSSNAIFCHFLLLIFCLRESTVQAANPLVPNNGMADPHARAFRGAVYIYATHDYSNKNTDFRMDDWWIWETTDLVHYSKVQEFQPMPWVKPAAQTECSTDAAEKNHVLLVFIYWPNRSCKKCSLGPWEDKPEVFIF